MFTKRERSYFMNERRIVETALGQLKATIGIEGKWEPIIDDIDGEIEFFFHEGNVRFYVEAKQELRQYQLPQLYEAAAKYQPLMIVGERIFPALKEKLREKKIGYLDGAGNIFMDTARKLIWIDGNKAIEREKEVMLNRAFTKTGLKTVFYLLLFEEAVNLPYRQIAKATNVALGNITNVIDGLDEAGFIIRVDKRRLKLRRKRELLDRWIAGYGETLKPALFQGVYRLRDGGRLVNWKDLPLATAKDKWGGEPAGDILTGHLVPGELTLYTSDKVFPVAKWPLIPDREGNIYLYEKFWSDENLDLQQTVPPILVYADLMLTGEPRCQEIAAIIYKNDLQNEFE